VEIAIVAAMLMCIVAAILFVFSVKEKGLTTKAEAAVQRSKHLKVVPIQGIGYTDLKDEVELVGDKIRILYTPEHQEGGLLVETAHILLIDMGFLTIERIGSSMAIFNGELEELTGTQLTYEIKVAIADIFKGIKTALEEA
jgi:hypothetical protein